MEMQKRRDQEHHEMVVRESHRRQMEGYGSQQSGSSSGSVPPPPSEPPRYVPPPPPKGWQSRFTGFVTFKIGQDEDQDPSRFRYDYAIAMNYGSAEEAKAAATNLCRERVLRSRESFDIDYQCEQSSYVYKDAFLSLVTHWNGSFGLYDQPTMELAISQHGQGIEIGGRTYYCADPSNPTPDNCQSWLFGIGLNGSHRDPGKPSDFRIFACPAGPPGPLYKVIGVDRLSGADVPLCGPDPVAFTVMDRAERWDAYATHPRYVLPFAVGGFADLAAAQKAALDMCTRFAGAGCAAAGEAKNGFAVWVRNEEARLFLGTGPTEEAALLNGRVKCSAGQVSPCAKVVTRIAGDLRVYGPRDKSNDLRYFGALALPGGKVGEDRLGWISYNMENQSDADRYALQACQSGNRTKAACKIVAGGLGTTIFGYSGLDGSRGTFSLMKRGLEGAIEVDDRVATMLKAICEPKGTLCRSVGGVVVSDDGEGRQPGITTLQWPRD
ncbi:MAG: hypothetical protein HC788_00910 [Sphingopyxis sp.]|nr:hypothetical protein [Sphingopyxis sp.]